jgi:electron transport complex protein RnfG
MNEMIKMVVVLTALSAISGGLLGYAEKTTKPLIEQQVIKFVKGPALAEIFDGASNDPINDRFSIEEEGLPKRDFFVAKYDNQVKAVAFEATGKGGYGGGVGLLVAVDVTTDQIFGLRVTTHSETAGLGAKAKTDPKFAEQFNGKSALETFTVSGEGQKINAISGATITSGAVCRGASEATETYQRLKSEIEKNLDGFK